MTRLIDTYQQKASQRAYLAHFSDSQDQSIPNTLKFFFFLHQSLANISSMTLNLSQPKLSNSSGMCFTLIMRSLLIHSAVIIKSERMHFLQKNINGGFDGEQTFR
jgi:hypothetical protein